MRNRPPADIGDADPALPARTVTGSASQDWVRLPGGKLRRLTWLECAGLQGFPPGWVFAGSKASRFKQVGNAVPVALGHAIGLCLPRALAAPRSGTPSISAPLPREFDASIAYTWKEQARNGRSRARVLRLERTGRATRQAIKGTGSADGRRA